MKKALAILSISAMILFLTFAVFNLASASLGDWNNELNKGADNTEIYNTTLPGSSSEALGQYIGSVLKIVALLSIIFLVQIILAGYTWLTATGNKDKIKDSERRMVNAAIGLIIFIGLYVITYFIVKKIGDATGFKI